jgi:hypothetical protein
MKFTKLSLIAVLAVTSAFAGESTITGDAKLFYSTSDIGNADLFNKNGAMGNAAVSLDYAKEIADGITINAGATGISTLGLESTLVSSTWVNHALKDRVWLDVANVTAKLGNTTAVIGRQKLDTPLAFTETWNIVDNTFDAFTFVNNDVADTTLVGSLVTRANGPFEFDNIQGGQTDLVEGIYAFGAVTKLIPNTTAQAWYYNSETQLDQDDKLWLQVDANVAEGVTVGLQYAMAMADTDGEDDSSLIAGKFSYDANGMGLFAAYSKADDDGHNSFANYAGYGMSNVYTEAWWNFGMTTVAGAEAMSIGASMDVADVALTAQFTTVSNDVNTNNEMDELTLTASKKVGPVDATLAFVNTSSDHLNDDGEKDLDGNTVQAYLTVPFSL